MFELTRLKVHGFRGFVDEREFIFDQPVVLLCGENHLGKSSTLNAIEWCLFGDSCVGKQTGIRERIGWEIANRYLPAGNVAVTVEFSGPKGIYKVTREQSITKKRGVQRVAMFLPDGTVVHEDEAELLLYTLFRSSFQDFMTTVYQHQEAIRAILTQEPRERNDAIDRLLGLSQYRELLGGIARAGLDTILKDMDGKRENFRVRCGQAISTLSNLIKEEIAKAVREGITEKEMTEQVALQLAKNIAETVKSLAQELGVVDFQSNMPTVFGDIAEFREWVKNETDRLWTQTPDVTKQTGLVQEQRNLNTLKSKLETDKVEEATAQKNMTDFVKQFGDDQALDKDIQKQQKTISDLDDQIRKTNAKANLIREAVQYLEDVAPAVIEGRCPLCGASAPNLLQHLKDEWEKKVKAEVAELDRQRKECKSSLEQIEGFKYKLKVLQKDLQSAKSRYNDCVKNIAAALKRKIEETDDPLSLLTKCLEQIEKELKLVDKAITEKRKTISGIYDQLAKLRTIHEILTHEHKRSIIERIFKMDQFLKLEELLNGVSRFVEDVKTIKSTLTEVSREEAETKINAAGAALNSYFCRIAKHPAIAGLVMEVTEDRKAGLNSYAFKSKDGTDPTPILSQGDLNCLALSLFLGLSEATGETQRFSFLMLDDPTQSLGPEMKGELARVLEDIAHRRNLIIATPDTEFKELITTEITKGKVVYTFTSWTKADGPKVTKAS